MPGTASSVAASARPKMGLATPSSSTPSTDFVDWQTSGRGGSLQHGLPTHLPVVTCGLYYKHVTIINYPSSDVNKLKASLIDDARVVIYNCHMFIVQATGPKTLRHNRAFLHEMSHVPS